MQVVFLQQIKLYITSKYYIVFSPPAMMLDLNKYYVKETNQEQELT